MNYDPNLTNSGLMATQTVKLTFAQWEYRATMETKVGGNCTGLDVISCAVGSVYDKLPVSQDKWKIPRLVMQKPNGEILECDDEEDQGDSWLKDMLIAAEITDIKSTEN